MGDLGKQSNIRSDYAYLLTRFIEEEIGSRYDYVNTLLESYIKQNQYENKVAISQDVLEHIIIDYYVDIDRLKDFQEIEYPNENKIYSYLAYWILRHKPLQLIKLDGESELAFVNENFVTDLLCSYLFSKPEGISWIEDKREIIDEFIKTLEYHLSYRLYSAQNIELILLAFQAGCGFQYCVDYQS